LQDGKCAESVPVFVGPLRDSAVGRAVLGGLRPTDAPCSAHFET
jgi:hypothetical protein